VHRTGRSWVVARSCTLENHHGYRCLTGPRAEGRWCHHRLRDVAAMRDGMVIDACLRTLIAGSWALKGDTEEPLDGGAFTHRCACAAASLAFLQSLVVGSHWWRMMEKESEEEEWGLGLRDRASSQFCSTMIHGEPSDRNERPPTNGPTSWPILVAQIYQPRPTTWPGVWGSTLREEKDVGWSFRPVFLIYSEENVFPIFWSN
jgi:hypothetical protein